MVTFNERDSTATVPLNEEIRDWDQKTLVCEILAIVIISSLISAFCGTFLTPYMSALFVMAWLK